MLPTRLSAFVAAALLLIVAAACDNAVEPAPLQVEIALPAAGTVVHAPSVDVVGTVIGSETANLSYTINGGAPVAVTPTRGEGGTFSFEVADIPQGSVALTVHAVEGRSEGSASRAFERVEATLSLVVDASGVRYGTVIPFSGTLSHENLTVRYSVNGEAERAVDQSPFGPFRGEAHPLRSGTNTIVVRAYEGTRVAAAETLEVVADVPQRTYDVTKIVELPAEASLHTVRLGNDGRVAGSWGPGTHYTFTWRDGVLVPLSGMDRVHDVNNVGQVLGAAPGTYDSIIWQEGIYSQISAFGGATLINDHGHLANATTPGYWNGVEFVRYSDADAMVRARSIVDMNNHGALVGRLADYSGGTYAIAWLNPPAGAKAIGVPAMYSRNPIPQRIGDGGHVLVRGYTTTGAPEFDVRAFVFHGGTLSDLTALVGYRFAAGGVNAHGVVAGVYTRDAAVHAATWQDGRTTGVALSSTDWNLVSVHDVNDKGQMLAEARHKVTGTRTFLLLTPAP